MDRRLSKEEKALIRRLRAGDEEASREFFERHRGPAYGVAMGILHRHADAMDVVQEAFLKAFRNIGSFRGRASLATWFRRIVVNTALDALRSRRAKREIDTGLELESIAGDSRAKGLPLPEDEAKGKELGVLLEEALSRLPEPQRVVLALYAQGRVRYAQIAETLHVPVGTVMSRLYYARSALRQALQGIGYFEEES